MNERLGDRSGRWIKLISEIRESSRSGKVRSGAEKNQEVSGRNRGDPDSYPIYFKSGVKVRF
jgi:hypothetical protein